MFERTPGTRRAAPCHATSPQQLAAWASGLAIPALSIGGLLVYMMREHKGGPLRAFKMVGNTPTPPSEVSARFADVAGIDEVKAELEEIVQFLKTPQRFAKVGAKVPRGCLLVGPPGTGKTLLARAVAGEANVPFFSVAASEFVELYVGVGASRVRELFNKARKHKPAIIFIDELDAVGKARGRGVNTNDEREQTINQLLTEMDGFAKSEGVIVLAATNRQELLDPALLRPGRFDRQIYVDLPDRCGREKILLVHSRGKSLSKDVAFAKVAKRTAGFSGADLANLINEAAILAVRQGKDTISQAQLEQALERVTSGVARQSKISPASRRLVAVHEAGHALVGTLCQNYDLVAKVSIVPRGRAGGLTFFEPNEERTDMGLYSRAYLEQRLMVALGGRAAEEAVFGADQVTTGASSDLQNANRVARAMITDYGWGAFGPLSTGAEADKQFYRAEGNVLTDQVDRDVLLLVNNAWTQARLLVRQNADKLNALADALCEKNDIDGEEVRRIVAKGSR